MTLISEILAAVCKAVTALRGLEGKLQGHGAYQASVQEPHPSPLRENGPAPLWEGSCSVVRSWLSIGCWM